jgi:Predicted membrane protein
MSDIEDKINQLESRLDQLLRTQIAFQETTSQIRYEIGVLRATLNKREQPGADKVYRQPLREPVISPVYAPGAEPPQPHPVSEELGRAPSFGQYTPPKQDGPRPNYNYTPTEPWKKPEPTEPGAFGRWATEYADSARANLEEFIGENLISKVGIIILVLGIGIGVKFAIDNNLISPVTRIIFGYLFGFGLIGLAIKLKPKYHNFSAVLLSGGMAAMYFVTYFAYALYALLGQTTSFALMTMFTVFTVSAALIYNRQVIAHIGLVGAYAVPFLLSNNSGAYAFLFSYISLVNAGILAISIKRAWRPILYTASGFTWLIFFGWFTTKFSAGEHFYLALVFLWLFFAILYAANIVLGRRDNKNGDQLSLVFTAANAVVFYGFCFGISAAVTDSFQRIVIFAFIAAASLLIQVSSSIPMITVEGARRVLFYIASAFTWGVFLAWFLSDYRPADHFAIALTFLTVFFSIFFASKVVQGKLHSESADLENLISVLATTFIFYAFALGISNAALSIDLFTAIFSLIAAVTLTVLIVSLRIYGRSIVYVAYPFTWLIYGVWFAQYYDQSQNFVFAVTLASVFFAIFYVTTLVIRLTFDDLNLAESAGLILTNSFIFYGYGYAIMESRQALQGDEGLYTVGHSALHLAAMGAARNVRRNATDVGYVLLVLVLTFATIAVPVQFDGNRVTMIWAVEGALLFWVARLKQIKVFEYFSYPVMLLATGSLLLDWILVYWDRTAYASEYNRQVFANGDFVTALVYLGAFACIFVINRNERLTAVVSASVIKPISYIVGAAWLIVLYNTFRIEISNYFHLWSVAIRANELTDPRALSWRLSDNADFNFVWQFIYTVVFVTVVDAINLRWLRSAKLAAVSFAVSSLNIMLFATFVMYAFYDLRLGYFMWEQGAATFGGYPMNFAIRYVCYVAIGGLYYVLYESCRDSLLTEQTSERQLTLGYDAILFIPILVAVSCELMNLMVQFKFADSTKYGLSVLWGVYALAIIALGIKFGKKHLRIGGIVLLGITLSKLFVYDISDLPTIPKTLLFVSLGILLLIVSFLYTKYKFVIFGEPEEEKLGA